MLALSCNRYRYPHAGLVDWTMRQDGTLWWNSESGMFPTSHFRDCPALEGYPSSQVEGRNGYLAFVHKANRGLPLQRLQVPTVVHNFDIRREDGTTPAERLFDQIFPDLFEFIFLNVTGFPEPGNIKNKSPGS